MKKVFDSKDLYRIGGDEFLAIVTSVTREEFEKMVERIRKLADEDQKISMAIGPYWSNGNTSTRDALRKADEEMYRNKKSYYARHPELDRRNR